jgi:hypothetical protein
MDEIIKYLDNYLDSTTQFEITAVQANAVLHKANLLRDSSDRPGQPLRKLLRQGKIPHAYQNGNFWFIPRSQRSSVKTEVLNPATFANVEVVKKSTPYKAYCVDDFMNDEKFQPAQLIDDLVPATPGLYCIKIKDPKALPAKFRDNLADRKHDILYIGIASKSLISRLHQELRARGHGTLFRSIGAMLGYRPEPGSLNGKRNQHNYKFSHSDNQKIISWINSNLLVRWVETNDNIDAIECSLITQHRPLLNLAHNPEPFDELKLLRRACERTARGE